MTKTRALRKVRREGVRLRVMRYRTKLYASLAGTAFVSSLCGFGVLFFEFRDHTFHDDQTRALTVAATTAALFDADLLSGIHVPADEASPAYIRAKDELKRARDANRNPNVFIKFVYIIKPNPNNPAQLIYLVDAEEDPRLISHVGDLVEDISVPGTLNHLHDYYSPGGFTSDLYGVWISGFAPIYDS